MSNKHHVKLAFILVLCSFLWNNKLHQNFLGIVIFVFSDTEFIFLHLSQAWNYFLWRSILTFASHFLWAAVLHTEKSTSQVGGGKKKTKVRIQLCPISFFGFIFNNNQIRGRKSTQEHSHLCRRSPRYRRSADTHCTAASSWKSSPWRRGALLCLPAHTHTQNKGLHRVTCLIPDKTCKF